MKLTETEIRRQIQDYLRLKGYFVYYNLQGLGCYPGLSDLVAIKKGIVYHIEIKTPRGKQSDKQIEFQRQIEAAGGRYVLARCVEDVMEL
jgi:Holliday junction resolvase